MGSKVSDEVALLRDLPPGVDQRSPCRHPDFLGPDDLVIKIEELREATDWQIPIFVKMGASRVFDDVRLAAKAGADVIVVDGMEGGTGASPELLQEHTGIPTLAAVCEARAALEDIGLYGKVQLIIAGGLRHGSDCAKALALGADACYLGTALLIALNCNKPIYRRRLPQDRRGPLLLPSLPHRPLPGRHHHSRPRAQCAAGSRLRRRACRQLLPCPHFRDPDPRAQPAARATCITSSPRTCGPFPWRLRSSRACPWRAPTGSSAAAPAGKRPEAATHEL